jgi:hypothetical protein
LFDCDAYAHSHPNDHRQLKYVLPELLCGQGGLQQEPTTTFWFHGTRVLGQSSLSQGLNPLNLQLDQIWTDLFQLAAQWIREDEWHDFRNTIEHACALESSSMYRHRLAVSADWGPHAVLIRDALIHPNRFSGVDYLRAPEIIEDICRSFEGHFGYDLLAEFQHYSHPCIVKFRNEQSCPNAPGIALSYLWCWTHEQDCTSCNTCFETTNGKIPSNSIAEVETLASL